MNKDRESDSAPVRVLVVDDSAFMRKMISDIVAADQSNVVVGTANDGNIALERIDSLKPDVVILDLEMPNLDGLGVLGNLALTKPESRPLVIVVSATTQQAAAQTVQCLELGAFDFVHKPSGTISLDIQEIGAELISKVRAAAGTKLQRAAQTAGKAEDLCPASARSRANPAPRRLKTIHKARAATGGSNWPEVIAIGASTGGPPALLEVIRGLPAVALRAPIVIVQHMPPFFTASLARRLDASAPHGLRVLEAAAGDRLRPGIALLAPGGSHLLFDDSRAAILTEDAVVNGVRPAIDVTITSLVNQFGDRMVAVLLTGMGRDGARSLKLVRDVGGNTIVQHESTCVVYGMPRAAVEAGAAQQILPLPMIASAIGRLFD